MVRCWQLGEKEVDGRKLVCELARMRSKLIAAGLCESWIGWFDFWFGIFAFGKASKKEETIWMP